ncbi:UDP-N-acetylmuramoyl-L-alanyl-D-glutamate--2,6-diaminopimelate ligase [Candidatus Dependentiae bacterium]|nr:UDP-N-acetylmuramoyl-L-alanyl-D-glutamate--2,6-diaminopimelate ligase [Candidatus Dependentiae bacterium]
MTQAFFPKIYPVACHTNNVGPQTTFVAIKGQHQDGVNYIGKALELGARSIVVQRDACITENILAMIDAYHATINYVDNARIALAQLSAAALGYPAKKLRIIGITGTKGKTSTAFLLEHVLRCAGFKTALLGTVKNMIDGQEVPHELTTPQPDFLHQFFACCVAQNVDYVIMEVAAQALSLHRLDGVAFDMALFTNFSQEHGEFYASIQDYFDAKKRIFDYLKPDASVLVNADDTWCKALSSYAQAQGYSLGEYYAQMPVSIIYHHNNQSDNITCPVLIGKFNCYNVLAAVTAAHELGVSVNDIQRSMLSFRGVPGRMERYRMPNGAQVIIDYAHNPSSFSAVLSVLKSLTDHLIVVFGCGGDRDANKRPIMGNIATQHADLVFITIDNPRSENPQTIIDQIYHGVSSSSRYRVIKELDRERAIVEAYRLSRSDSIIALLGKGPDEYQLVAGIKHVFSEKSIILRLSAQDDYAERTTLQRDRDSVL